MHWNRCRGRHAIAELAKLVGDVHVEGPASGAADLVLCDVADGEAGGRIENGKVKPKFVEPLVKQTWEHSRSAIESVSRRHPPERFLRAARLCALLRGHAQRFLHIAATAPKRIDHLLPSD